MLVALYSPNGTTTRTSWPTMHTSTSTTQFTRVPGIASVQVFGAGQYAMRFWVKPDQLAKLGITVPDVVNAVQSQNTVNPAGQIGGEPAPQGPGIHLLGAGAGPSDHAGTIRRHHRARKSRWRCRSGEGRGAHRARRAELQH